MISWIKSLVNKSARTRYKHDRIVGEYREVAAKIGCAISDMGLGDSQMQVHRQWLGVRDPELYHILDELEEAYASLGYRIIPLQEWVDYGGWGVPLEHLWLVKRKEDERPQFTKFNPRAELPKRSYLVDMVWETGKAHEAYRDENGDIQYREIKD